VRAAASEGRDAMRATEAELRARVEQRTFVGPATAEPPPEAEPPAAASTSRRRARR